MERQRGALSLPNVTTAAYIASLAIQEMQLFMEKWEMFDEARIVASFMRLCSGLTNEGRCVLEAAAELPKPRLIPRFL